MKNNINNCGLETKYIQQIINILSKYIEIQKAILYGSRATGKYKNASDIDIAIQGEKLSEAIISNIHSDLEEETVIPYFFDITHYEEIKNQQLKNDIDNHGIILYKV